MRRTRGSLPAQLPAAEAEERLRHLTRFLVRALPLCRAHTTEFYTRGLWEQLVAARPEVVLQALRRPLPEASGTAAVRWDDDSFSDVFCEDSKKLINIHLFALAAKHYSLPNLGVCTPLEEVLEALRGESQRASVPCGPHCPTGLLVLSARIQKNLAQEEQASIKTDEFMNNKKSHEVQAMSELVDKIAKYCGLKQVIDIGSGKGYLSSFLSMQYNLKVYGIDSSKTNTNGAHERNRKLKKHWKTYQSRARANSETQRLEKPMKNEVKCKAINEKPLNNNSSLQSQEQGSTQDSVPSCVFTEVAISETSKQTEISLAQAQSDESKLSEEALAILNVLPADAVEVFSSSHCNYGEICEEEKAQRKMAFIKAKVSKSRESNLYFPLTSYISAETELSDIITDLEDCIMVGLHTCGDLAANTLRIFTAKPEIKAVCSVGCCYHLLSEQYENQEDCTEEVWGFPMCQYLKDKGWCCGRNARMSACLALERVAVGQMLPTESLFYRAVLQVIIEETYGVTKSDRHVGKIFSKSSSFLDYVRKSLKKLELDDSKLKVVLAPCVEVLILLDRLCYLKEQNNIAWSGLVKLFDPVKSPRCYAVIALKKQSCL
ncbi:probable methyltransferase-like protein 25 isoform X2 [Excalfactoria chinensis]|uniref:probable methyltransferase-like protein 25 isoform X2 n=1 Tax=Excalfactoria chinensis TaxID=46218 RepID=UPI003B3A038F